MMAKMTQQEIQAFALQYHGIECVKIEYQKELLTPIDWLTYLNHFQTHNLNGIEHIELRSIESLTDEELKKVAKYEATGNMDCDTLSEISDCLFADTVDYLRSIGVAVEFRDYSVEEMIEQGILKLKDK